MYAPFLYAFPCYMVALKKFASRHGATFFGAWLRLRTFFICGWRIYEYKNPQKVIDVIDVELTPGEPTVCFGNGEQGFECCCDECDYFLFCFPEFDPEKKE